MLSPLLSGIARNFIEKHLLGVAVQCYTQAAPGSTSGEGESRLYGEYLGLFQGRLDAAGFDEGSRRRKFMLTLSANAPHLSIGDTVRIEGLEYRVDNAEDMQTEQFSRKYDVSLFESDFRQTP